MHDRYREQDRERAVERSPEEVVVRHHDSVDQLADDSLERTQNALSTLVRTDQIADATLEELDAQGEKLITLVEGLDTVAYEQKKAEYHERSIRSFWGWLYNQFIPKPAYVDHAADLKAQTPAAVKNVSITNSGVNTLFANDGRAVDPMVDQAKLNARQKIAASDKHLAQMSDVLSGLQHKSMLMNDELVKQTDQVKVLNKTTDDANVKFDYLNRRITSL